MELNGLLVKFRGPSEPNSAATPLPSFVLLHGYGSNEDDLFAFERLFPSNSAVFSLRAPLSLVQGGRAWFSIDFERPRSEWSNQEEAEQSIIQLLGALDCLSRMKSDTEVDRRTPFGTPHPTSSAKQLAATRNQGMFLDADTKVLESEK